MRDLAKNIRLPSIDDLSLIHIYNLLIAITIAVVIVLAMNLVGSLLISALIIFPALSAMRVYKNFRAVTILSLIHI